MCRQSLPESGGLAALVNAAAAGATLAGAGSGYLVASAGWPVFFATTMAMAVPALIVLWFLPAAKDAGPSPASA
jgi:sugar phosphate permease